MLCLFHTHKVCNNQRKNILLRNVILFCEYFRMVSYCFVYPSNLISLKRYQWSTCTFLEPFSYCSKTPLDLTLLSDKLAKLSFAKYCSLVRRYFLGYSNRFLLALQILQQVFLHHQKSAGRFCVALLICSKTKKPSLIQILVEVYYVLFVAV